MMDLKLNAMEEDKPFSYEELIEATNDYYEAMEELTSAEQELFEVNRACENLVALQDIVAKHGWSAVLNELVGNQISSESLDASCEGAFDKIKQVASKVGSKLVNALQKAFNLFDIYVKRFKAAKEWLKKNKDAKASTEAFHGNEYSSSEKADIFYEMSNVVKLFKNGKRIFAKRNNQSFKDYVMRELDQYGDGGYYLSKCSNAMLVNLCDDVITNLPTLKRLLSNVSEDTKTLREDVKNTEHDHDTVVKQLKQTDSLRDAAKYEKYKNQLELHGQEAKGERYTAVFRKMVVHIAISSCRHLDAEIRKRGYKSEFTV